jgi:hypothetical protein
MKTWIDNTRMKYIFVGFLLGIGALSLWDVVTWVS